MEITEGTIKEKLLQLADSLRQCGREELANQVAARVPRSESHRKQGDTEERFRNMAVTPVGRQGEWGTH